MLKRDQNRQQIIDAKRQRRPTLGVPDSPAHPTVQQRLKEADQIACRAKPNGVIGGKLTEAVTADGTVRRPEQGCQERYLTGSGGLLISDG